MKSLACTKLYVFSVALHWGYQVTAFHLSPSSTRSKVSYRFLEESGRLEAKPLHIHRQPFVDNGSSSTKDDQSFLSALKRFSAVVVSTATIMVYYVNLPASVAWANAPPPTTQAPTITQLISKKEEQTVIDEVANLVQKYFIDKTYNGQNWDEVRAFYMENGKNVDKESHMKLITEMVKSLGDKYSRVLSTEQYAAIQKFDLIGVGVTLMPNAQKEIIVGAPPIEGSPSAKAGLKTGDFITAVNGKSTKGRTAFDIIDQISEKPDARTVSFTVRRQSDDDLSGEGDTFDVTMERQNFMVKDPVQYKLSEQRKDGTNVGYIRVSEFNSMVNSKLQDALVDLKKQGANAFVLDLRSNTGGAFQSAVEISGFFFEDRVATYVIDSNEVELPFRTPKGKIAVDPESPLVVWLDGLSASASEVLAGSLHDNCRAVTMGDKSFGKGLIQAVYGLKNGAGLVLSESWHSLFARAHGLVKLLTITLYFSLIDCL